MPDINSGIALGALADGIGSALQAKKQREYEEQAKQHDLVMGLVASGLKDGTVKDPQAAFQFLLSGGSGKGKKGKELPPMLQSLIGATHKLTGGGGDKTDPNTTMGGQAKPSFGAPEQGGTPQFTTQGERTASDEATKLQGEKNRFEAITKPEIEARGSQRLKEIEKTNEAKYGPGTLVGRINAEFDNFKAQNGRDPSPEEQIALTDKARGAWQGAGRKESDYKTFEQTWLKDASANGPLTPGQQKAEMLKAKKAWALASQSETPNDKLGRAEALERFKNQLNATTPEDVKSLSQSVTIGDKTTPYFDLSSVSGVKEKNSASRAAIAQGIIPVSAKQAEQLESAGSASANLNDFLGQVQSRLPKDAANRPLTAVENKLSQFFQTDEELASAVSWDLTIFPMLRAMSVTNRINQQEMALAIASRPKLDDTVGVAAKKVAIINKIINHGASQILNRGEKDTPAASSRGQSATVPPAVSSVLKGKKAGHYKLKDEKTGATSEYDVAPDGSITASKKAA